MKQIFSFKMDLQRFSRVFHKSKKGGYLIFIVVFLMSSCTQRKPWEADIRNVSIEPIELLRYEKLLFSIDPLNIKEELEPHINDYYLFLGDDLDHPMAQQQLFDYITDPFISELYQETMEEWEDVSELERDLNQAFLFYRYHFPENPIPVIYTYISGLDFDMPVKYFDNHLIIGLDMFMGRDFPKYEKIGIPSFKRNRFSPNSVSVELMHTLASEQLPSHFSSRETLLDHIVYEGKLLYFIDCMLPELSDSLKIYYTDQSLKWAERNQAQSWAFFIDNDLLYSTDRQMIQKFIGPAPFTAPFSRGSAPRIGVYIGWQIVREYMRRNPDKHLTELFNETDSRKILSESRYRP